jgi:uncharacterized protein (TIRG00374 family)
VRKDLSSATTPYIRSSHGERALRLAERLVLALGIILFVVILARLGIDNVLTNLRVIGWGILLIIAVEFIPFVFNTLGWRAAFPRGGRVPSFRQLLLARIAGEAANYLTPTATMGGEFVRVRMLQEQTAVRSLVASALVAKLTQAMGLVLFVLVGLLLLNDDTLLRTGARWGIFGGMTLFAAVVIGLLVLQRYGFLGPTFRFLQRCPGLRFLASFQSSMEQIDAEMTKVHRESKGRIVVSSTLFGLGFATGLIESYLILWFLGIDVSFRLALAVEVLSAAVNNLMFFVPLRAGIQEAGKALVFAMLGLSPAQGLAAGVICRIRELTWALIGLAILARSRPSLQALRGVREDLPLRKPSSPKIAAPTGERRE